MYCKNCGAQIDDKAYICPNCGVKTGGGYDANAKNKKNPVITPCLICKADNFFNFFQPKTKGKIDAPKNRIIIT